MEECFFWNDRMSERKLPCWEGNYCVTEYAKHSGYVLEPHFQVTSLNVHISRKS